MDELNVVIPVNLLPQKIDVHFYHVGASIKVNFPDLFAKLLLGNDPVGIPDKIIQQGKFLGGQVKSVPGPLAENRFSALIHFQV